MSFFKPIRFYGSDIADLDFKLYLEFIEILSAKNIKRIFDSTTAGNIRRASKAPIVREKDIVWKWHSVTMELIVVMAVCI